MNHLISLLFSLPRENKRLITVTVFLLWEPFCIPSYQVKWQWDAKWHNDFTEFLSLFGVSPHPTLLLVISTVLYF